MVDVILVELTQDHRLEVTPLAQRLADVVSLLPAMHPVLRCILLRLAGSWRRTARIARAQAMSVIIEDAGNVVVECAA